MSTHWPEIEIQELPPLRSDQESMLDMHSLLNILSVVHGELSLIGLHLHNDDQALAGALAACREFIAGLRQRETALRCASQLSTYRDRIAADINLHLSGFPSMNSDPELMESVANIESVFSVLALRSRELLARAESPERWIQVQIPDLSRNFLAAFKAIEKNSKGRYRIIYNLAQKESNDYYITMNLDSVEGEIIWMPPVFIDVMRDLMANARKYTAPGGSIAAGLYESKEALRLVVHDTGRGINEAELSQVVHYGYRGTNVSDIRTMGGGFGLTKALFVTKQFKGRMWLSSKLGEGTVIRIELPRPAELR